MVVSLGTAMVREAETLFGPQAARVSRQARLYARARIFVTVFFMIMSPFGFDESLMLMYDTATAFVRRGI